MSGTYCIVQARYGSTRLPGKVMQDFCGRTFLEHALDRCRRFSGIADVICAISDAPESDCIERLCRERGYRFTRGSEQDVLARYHHAAVEAGAEAVVRVTSDCPLIDPAIADAVIARFREGGHDLVTTNIPPTWPVGLDVEIFTMRALAEAFREAVEPAEREHVSTFIRHRPERYRLASLPCPVPGLAALRVTLDTAEDRDRLRRIAEVGGEPVETMPWRRLVEILTGPQAGAAATG